MRTAQVSGDTTFTGFADAVNCEQKTNTVKIFVEVPSVPPASCDDGKPKALWFQYVGRGCTITNPQGGKAKCAEEDVQWNDSLPVQVKYTGKDSSKIGVFPDDETVDVNEMVLLDAFNRSELQSTTKLEILQGGVTVQMLEIKTDCREPLNVNDQFGSLILKEFISQ